MGNASIFSQLKSLLILVLDTHLHTGLNPDISHMRFALSSVSQFRLQCTISFDNPLP
jgi:hypothetical protein